MSPWIYAFFFFLPALESTVFAKNAAAKSIADAIQVGKEIIGAMQGITVRDQDPTAQNDVSVKRGLKYVFGNLSKIFDPLRKDIEKKILHPVPLDKVSFVYVDNLEMVLVQLNPLSPRVCDNPFGKIYFVIHGWLESREEHWYEDLTLALIRHDKRGCVIQVDWHKPALETYLSAVYYTESVGEHIANLIIRLNIEHDVGLDRFVLIGHSLGAHVAGWAGKKVLSRTNLKIGRIIGLDPSGPIFDIRDGASRLSRYDAKVVEVIHTDVGKWGIDVSIGTIDFYPNGGTDQPGCEININIPYVTDKMMNIPRCGHERSWHFLIEAIENPGGFLARRCGGWEEFLMHRCDPQIVSMGNLETRAKGDFYLATNSQAPYAKFLRP